VQQNLKVFNCDTCDCDDEHSVSFEKWSIPEINLSSKICLRWLVTHRSIMLLRLYNQYRVNILPLSGGWLEQPNVFVQAIEAIDAHKAKSERRKN